MFGNKAEKRPNQRFAGRMQKKTGLFRKLRTLVRRTKVRCSLVKRAEAKKTSALCENKSFVEITKQYAPVQAMIQEIIVEKGTLKIRIPIGICREELQVIICALGGVS